MFPAVFAYPVSKQEMQLSSFFDTQERANSKAACTSAPLSSSHHYAFGAAPPAGSSGGGGGGGGAVHAGSCLSAATPGLDIEGDHGYAQAGAGSASAHLLRQPMLYATRRVVKLTVAPAVSALVLGSSAVLITVLCVLVPGSTAPVIETLWGSFTCLWLLATIMQFVTHSVFLCTTLGHAMCAVHFAVVAFSAIVVPRALFSHWMWLAPCLCVVVVVYQAYMFGVVFAQYVERPWVYASLAGTLALLPVTQLAQIPLIDDDTRITCLLWSALSVYTIYAFAFVNSLGSAPVDVTIGTNPTRPQHE